MPRPEITSMLAHRETRFLEMAIHIDMLGRFLGIRSCHDSFEDAPGHDDRRIW